MPTDDVSVRLSLRDRARFSAEARRASEDIEQIGDEASRADRILAGLGRMGKGVGRALGSALKYGALAAGTAIVGMGAYSVKAAVEAENAQATVRQAIRSTGGVANVTAADVGKLSNKIMAYSGISDEMVTAGQGMFVTFTNIRNETGKGNKIFTRATKTLADMSAGIAQATGSEINMGRSAIQLGKALNDPIKGVSALGRVGVGFNEQQKAQIETMVESGRIMGAQKIILRELGTEFGGQARALGKTSQGQYNILKESLGNVAEVIGAAVLPSLVKLGKSVATFVGSDEFQRWLKDATKWLEVNLPKGIDTAAGFLKGLGRIIGGVVGWFSRLSPGVAKTILAFGAAIIVAGKLAMVLSALGAGPIGLLIAAVAGLAVYIIANWAQIKSETIRIFGAVRDFLGKVWNGIKDIASNAVGAVREVIGGFLSTVGRIWGRAWDGLKSLTRNVLATVVGFFLDFAASLVDGAAKAFGWIPGIGPKIKSAASEFRTWANDIEDSIRGVKGESDRAITAISGIGRAISNVGTAINLSVDTSPSGIAASVGPISARQHGGPIRSNVPYLVGERGPELRVFNDGPGAIRSNDELPRLSGVGGVHIHGDIIVNGVTDPKRAADLVIERLDDLIALH